MWEWVAVFSRECSLVYFIAAFFSFVEGVGRVAMYLTISHSVGVQPITIPSSPGEKGPHKRCLATLETLYVLSTWRDAIGF